MNVLSKYKAAIAGAFLFAVTAVPAYAQGAFDNVNANGQGLGKVSRNLASSLVDGASALEAVLYLAAIFFIFMFVTSLVKWKKSDGREANAGLIAVYLIASVFCIAAPTVMGGGISTLFGNGQVETVKAPVMIGG